MALFFIWTGIISSFLCGYCIYVWIKNRKRSRFQAKLTLFFLLFVLVPLIPLNLFIANVLTKSADMLLLPGIGEALEMSLTAMRSQLEEKALRFIEVNPDPDSWTQQILKKESLFSVGLFQFQKDSLYAVYLTSVPECPMPRTWLPPRELIPDLELKGCASYVHIMRGKHVITVCKKTDRINLIAVCFPVPDSVLRTKNKVAEALGVYNSLALIKESIIQKNIIWALAVLAILTLALLSIQVAKRLSRGISEPINKLVRGMHQIANGDFSSHVDVNAKDEIGFLTSTFNQMVQDLKTTREKLIRAEKIAAWQDAARQISHEIKNSLTPMLIALRRLNRLTRNDNKTGEIRNTLTTIEDELHSLDRMSSEFSDFAQLPQPKKQSISLNEIVRSSVRLSEATYDWIQIQTDLDPDLPYWDGDPEQLKRALNNLLKNASEASHKTGYIRLSTRLETSPEKRLLLEVEDKGEGMEEETLRRILTPYFSTKQRGSGLGLTIVEKIVKDHDGEIAFRSQKGRGTTVTLSFKVP
jgi:nitrogen fixation/metabolism regulation signal transduction histidine kinase